MDGVRGIGFDLFNTLITMEPHALPEAVERLCSSLRKDGIAVEREVFHKVHRKAALEHIAGTRRDGRETHNRFWISTALCRLGFALEPDDPRISRAVERYFSAFQDCCRLIPGTEDMLEAIKDRYRLGLLSNFTHPPAARAILERLGIASFFEVIVISGEIGYRKPHALVFEFLLNSLGLGAHELLYVGDDPEPDIDGARSAGIRTVWTTYVRDRNIPPVPGVTPEQLPTPNCPTQRISSWKELLVLLDDNKDPDES